MNNSILINDNKLILNNFESTGYKNNYISNSHDIFFKSSNSLKKILYDPQTNGPMLMSINPNNKEKFEKEFYKLSKRKPILIGTFEKKLGNLIMIE